MQHVYMATDLSAKAFNYRGEAGPEDNPHAFRDLMKGRGLVVLIRADAKPGKGKGIPRTAFRELP